MANRDWNDPEYRRWRRAVRRKAGYRCQLCGCRRRLQCHHVVRVADCPELLTDRSRGVLLCGPCHKRVTGDEALWAPVLMRLAAGRGKAARDGFIRLMMMRLGDGEGEGENPPGENPR